MCRGMENLITKYNISNNITHNTKNELMENENWWFDLVLGLFLFLLPVITMIGNLLVVISVLIEKTLQNSASNTFIVSLAVADISGEKHFFAFFFFVQFMGEVILAKIPLYLIKI